MFGKQCGDTQYEGLIGSDANAFCSKLEVLRNKSLKLDKKGNFYDWFVQYQSEILSSTMVKSVR